MPRKRERKTPRKTTLKKLAISTGVRGDPIGRPIELDWKLLEDAYRKPLGSGVRQGIIDILRVYTWWDESEHNAPLLKDALNSVNRRQDAACAMLAAMHSKDATKIEVERIIDAHMNVYIQDAEFLDLVYKYIDACNRVREGLQERSHSGGFEEGRAWKDMVAKLINLFEGHNLHVTITKDSPSAKLSPFVALIKAIGEQLPPPQWPWPSTDTSLSKAIGDVRKRLRECRSNCPHDFGRESS